MMYQEQILGQNVDTKLKRVNVDISTIMQSISCRFLSININVH